MTGYLSSGKVYDDLYNLMRFHYSYGIGYDFKEKRYNHRLVQHIAIAYLRNNETLNEEGSLFKKYWIFLIMNKLQKSSNPFGSKKNILQKMMK